MLCISGARTLVSLWYQGSEKSGFLGSVHGMKNTRSYIMTYTDPDRGLYINFRSLPVTLYMVYTIMYMFTEYAITTRSCSMTLTGHD